MKVTKTESQKNNKHRISVFVDNEYAFSLDQTDAVLLKIKPGRELSQKDIENCIMEGEFSKARDKAFDILSRKPVSRKALSDKLLEAGYDEAVVFEVLEETESLGYINDTEYAKLFLESCRAKMWGEKKIRYEMKQKGLCDHTIEEALEEYEPDEDTEEMVRLVISKYGSQNLSDIKTKAKITRYFVSRGFDYSFSERIIKSAIEESFRDE